MRVVWIFAGALCAAVVLFDLNCKDGRINNSIESMACMVHQLKVSSFESRPRYLFDENTIQPPRQAGLRHQLYRYNKRPKLKNAAQEEMDYEEMTADEATLHSEDVNYWNRVLQQGPSSSMQTAGSTMSMQGTASTSLTMSMQQGGGAMSMQQGGGAGTEPPSEAFNIGYNLGQNLNNKYDYDWNNNGRRNMKKKVIAARKLRNKNFVQVKNEELPAKEEKVEHKPPAKVEEMLEHKLPGKVEDVPPGDHQTLDFIIAGFPKCGTTTLLYAFKSHQETSIHDQETCAFMDTTISDADAYNGVNEALDELDQSPVVKRGIKCPTGLKNFRSIQRLENHSPNARIVVGMRHPVKFFESFYNYRITELYDMGKTDTNIPPAQSLIGSKVWRGVSTDTAQFETFLMQLGKTQTSIADLELLKSRSGLGVKPFGFKVFLYSVEQLEDEDTDRAAGFRNDMREFLQLEEPLTSFGRENKNYYVGDLAHPETIDICEDQYNDLRAHLVAQGQKTQEWIRDQLLESDDVFVGGKEYFLKLLDTWGVDPCRTSVLPIAET